MAFCQADKMLVDIAVDEKYKSGIYFCRLSEDVPLGIYCPRQYICKNMTVGAIILPLTKSNDQFQMQYSVMYFASDILKANGEKGLPQISHDLF